jgi:hypothetical protein
MVMANEQKALTRLAPGVWRSSEPVRIVGTRLTTSMTVMELGDGALLLHSPVSLTPELRAAVEVLGRVEHLYAPNLFHHLHVGEWSAAFPKARVHGAPGLAKKRPDLRIDRVHGAGAEPSFAGVVDELSIAGCRLDESVLVYRPARALVVADLVHNVGRPDDGWTRFYTKAMGFYDRVALSKVLRWTAFSDRAAARLSLDELLGRDFDTLSVGHGAPLLTGGKDALAAAYGWLAAK